MLKVRLILIKAINRAREEKGLENLTEQNSGQNRVNTREASILWRKKLFEPRAFNIGSGFSWAKSPGSSANFNMYIVMYIIV